MSAGGIPCSHVTAYQPLIPEGMLLSRSQPLQSSTLRLINYYINISNSQCPFVGCNMITLVSTRPRAAVPSLPSSESCILSYHHHILPSPPLCWSGAVDPSPSPRRSSTPSLHLHRRHRHNTSISSRLPPDVFLRTLFPSPPKLQY